MLLPIASLSNDCLGLGEMCTIFIRGGGEKEPKGLKINSLCYAGRLELRPLRGSSTLFHPPRDVSRVVPPTNQLRNACYVSLNLKFFKIFFKKALFH